MASLIVFQAPECFRGSLVELYRDHIERILPPPWDVARVHRWMAQYSSENSAVFPVRAVRGALRRQQYSTIDGTMIAPADNSPAWVIHALLLEGRLTSYIEFRELMLSIPTHMFDIRKVTRKTANHYGWYV